MENYEEKYKAALKRAQTILKLTNNPKEANGYVYTIFPELCESEDERIRKGLIKGLYAMRDIHKHQTFSDDAINIDDAIAWLEKQGEQKSVDWSEEDEEMYQSILDDTVQKYLLDGNQFAWFKSLKDRVQPQPKQEWSEEDELMLESTIQSLRLTNGAAQMKIDWLKSIKPNHWKPSEQNIKDLEWCADLVQDKMGVEFHRLQVFIDELKKL